MSGRTFAKQDLPPPGGYDLFKYQRTKLKNFLQPRYYMIIILCTTTYGIMAYRRGYKQGRREKYEMYGAKNAIAPILLAEKDRQLLKQMRKMREFETELMKDVDGWTVGKYYGEPIYLTRGENFFVKPRMEEFYLFGDPNGYTTRRYDYILL